ncbi:MAG: ABC transporter permease [Chthoniobacterales bacterium]
MSTFFSDLRYAVRMLLKAPAFTIIAVAALALGIGANTAIFSVVNAVLLRPLPYPEHEKLIVLRETTPTFPSGSVSLPNFLDWREGQRSFTDIALLRRSSVNFATIGGESVPERIGAAQVTWNFLAVLGIHPRVGRDFLESDDVPNAAKVALIAENLWQRQFGGSNSVLGKQIMVNGVAREIIGVLPADVRYPRLAQIYLPLDDVRAQENVLARGNHPGFSALGRLKPGITLQQANADLDAIAVGLEHKYPDTNTGRRVEAKPLLEVAVGDYRRSLHLLLGSVACVLLIACANVANLQLARAVSRAKELAIRAALGAGRWRLAAQLLTESTLLAALGGGAGIMLATWSIDAIKTLSPQNVPRFQEINIDPVALMFTAAIAVVAGILVGIWPAFRISGSATHVTVLHEAGSRGGSGGVSRQRARSALVVTQVALAVVLLAGAGLTLKSFWRAQQEPLNFDPHGILTVAIALPSARYETPEKVNAFNQQLVDRVGHLPGVDSAAIGVKVPFDDNEWDSYFHLTGTPPDEPGKEPSAEVNIVTSDYFKVMRMPILRGRNFGPEDLPGKDHARSVIVDDTFVQRYLQGRDPIGVRIDDTQRPASEAETAPPLTIVGVVPRTRNEAPGESNVEQLKFVHMYYYQPQYPNEGNTLLVRVASGDPMALVPAIKREVQALDPQQPIGTVSTMESNIANSLGARRLTMILLGCFAALALLLGSVGLYGVMALSVTQRMRELGIRVALGAKRGDVLRLVLGQGAVLVGVGLGLGLLGALAAGRLLASVLYQVGALDGVALLTAMTVLAVIAGIACWLPAQRATRVDPMVALRDE